MERVRIIKREVNNRYEDRLEPIANQTVQIVKNSFSKFSTMFDQL